MKIFGSIKELVSAVFRKSGYEVTVEPSTVSGTTTFQLPPASGGTKTLLTSDSSVTITGKTIDGDDNTIQDVSISSLKTVLGDASKAIVRDASGIVVSAKIVNDNVDAAANIAASKLSNGSVDDTEFQRLGTAGTAGAGNLVNTDGTQTLTGKTIDGDDNTLQDIGIASLKTVLADADKAVVRDAAGAVVSAKIVNANVDAAAGIGRAKLASGTASHVVVNDGSGAFSSEATLAKSRGGTGQDNSSITFPASGTIPTTADKLSAFAATTSSELAGVISDETGSGALVFGTAPTLDKPVVNQTNYTQAASATTPAAGKSAVYVNSGDSKLHVVDSSGNDVAVGSGSSGRNYLGDWFDSAKDIGTVTNSLTDIVDTSDRTANKTTWGSSNTSLLTIARSASSPLRQTYSYAITEAGSSAGAFVESPLFSLDSLDLGKPVTVSFDVSGNSTTDYYQVYVCRYDSNDVLKERIPIAGTASATSPYSARLPVGTTNFQGFFVAGSTSTDQYALRVVSNNNAADSLKIDSLYVGPQSVVQGAAVTDWVTPKTEVVIKYGTTTATNVTSYTTKYRRVGDTMEMQCFVAFSGAANANGNFKISLPDGLVIDSTKMSNVDSLYTSSALLYTSTKYYTGVMFPDANNNNLIIQAADGGTSASGSGGSATTAWAGNTVAGSNVPSGAALASGNYLSFTVRAPIVGWSSNVTMANRAVEEYAYNTDTSTSDDTTSFGYGAGGVAIGSFVSTTTGVTQKQVRFTTAIQPTDRIEVEIKDPTGAYSAWIPAAQYGFGYISQSTSAYGILIDAASETDVIVMFGKKGARPTNATYAGDGAAWSGFTDRYWRVRKVSGGASVGYPIHADNIVGGVVPPGGLIPIASNLTGSYAIPATGTVSVEGWQYCDGSAIPAGNKLSGSVPNLTDSRFLMGSSTAGTTGGAASVTLVANNLPTHTHSISASTVASSTHTHTEGSLVAQIRANVSNVTYREVSTTSYNSSIAFDPAVGRYASVVAATQGAGINGATDAPSATTTTASVTGNNTTTGSSFSILPTYLTAKYIIRVN